MRPVMIYILIFMIVGSIVFISGCTSAGAKCPACESTNTHKTNETDQRTVYKCDNCGAVFEVYKKNLTQSSG